MKRLHYYDNIRVVLMFLVLFGHFCEISAGTTTYGAFLRFFIYLFHMPLFVFVTGLFHSNRCQDIQDDGLRHVGDLGTPQHAVHSVP